MEQVIDTIQRLFGLAPEVNSIAGIIIALAARYFEIRMRKMKPTK
jgi:hypothetical protein